MKILFLTYIALTLSAVAQVENMPVVLPLTKGEKIAVTQINQIHKGTFFSVYLKSGEGYSYIQTGPPPPKGMFSKNETSQILSGDEIKLEDNLILVRCHYYKDDAPTDGNRHVYISPKQVDYILIQNAAEQGAAANP